MDIGRLKSRYIPEDIMTKEILARLPVKSVLRFSSVSKAWCRLFGSKQFIKTHHQFSAKKKARCSVLCGIYRLYHISVESLLIKGPINICEDINRVTSDGLEIEGYCDGLVCIKRSTTSWLQIRFILWNPSTRIFKELPSGRFESFSSCCIASGFGRDVDESSGAYKVCAYGYGYRIDNDDREILFEVYSSKTNSWKAMGDATMEFNNGIPLNIYGEGKFVSGKLHWQDRDDDIYRGRRNRIVWFDLKSEVFGDMELPTPDLESMSLTLGEHEGCLCVVSINDHEMRLDVWVMKEESWFHLVADVPLFHLFPADYKPPRMRRSNKHPVFSFVSAPDGEIWLCFRLGYLAYDTKRRLASPFKPVKMGTGIDGFSNPHLCIQSLVSP